MQRGRREGRRRRLSKYMISNTNISFLIKICHLQPKTHFRNFRRSFFQIKTCRRPPRPATRGHWAHLGESFDEVIGLLRLRRFRDARIDPSCLPNTDGPNFTESCRRKGPNIKRKNVETKLKTTGKGLA